MRKLIPIRIPDIDVVNHAEQMSRNFPAFYLNDFKLH